LAREVRRLNLALPVILCTGFGEHWTLERARATGAQGLLHKPVALWDLAAALRKVLDEAGSKPR
ncbi:MAG: response regulator, partial [Vicinamibacteria bacterium]|nr:response regulator [Vicinamibacteria bacterium]